MDRKSLIRQYKETPRPAGVFRVANGRTGKSLVGSSSDAPAMLNRIRAQLQMGSHPNRALQADWNAHGADAFSFEVLDLLSPKEGADADAAEDLRVLEHLWLEKLGRSGEASY